MQICQKREKNFSRFADGTIRKTVEHDIIDPFFENRRDGLPVKGKLQHNGFGFQQCLLFGFDIDLIIGIEFDQIID